MRARGRCQLSVSRDDRACGADCQPGGTSVLLFLTWPARLCEETPPGSAHRATSTPPPSLVADAGPRNGRNTRRAEPQNVLGPSVATQLYAADLLDPAASATTGLPPRRHPIEHRGDLLQLGHARRPASKPTFSQANYAGLVSGPCALSC